MFLQLQRDVAFGLIKINESGEIDFVSFYHILSWLEQTLAYLTYSQDLISIIWEEKWPNFNLSWSRFPNPEIPPLIKTEFLPDFSNSLNEELNKN